MTPKAEEYQKLVTDIGDLINSFEDRVMKDAESRAEENQILTEMLSMLGYVLISFIYFKSRDQRHFQSIFDTFWDQTKKESEMIYQSIKSRMDMQ